MSGSEKVVTIMILAGVAFLMSVVLGSQSYSKFRDAQITEMVKAGADPLAASCALSNAQDRSVCVVVAVKK